MLSSDEKLLFCEALFLHLWVGLLLKIIPFRKIPGLFGNRENGSRCKVQGARSEKLEPANPEPLTLIQIKSAIQRASRVSPWKNKCLVSSLAARRMLNRRRIESQVLLGVAKDSGKKLIAHAWIRSGDFEVVEKNGRFMGMYRF